jgi:Peptidase family C25
MKQFYALITAFLLAQSISIAQPYGNEWIAFTSGQALSSQQYFRIGIWKEGVYRVTYTDMLNNGVPVTSWFSLDRFQVYASGKEQFINVVDVNADNIFGPGDYVEFYGKGNDGTYDRALYMNAEDQPNPYYSIYNDTASYFLTYSPFSTNNRRMPILNDNNFGAYSPESYFISENVKVYGAEYNIGWRDYNDIADNSFSEGEGFLSNRVNKNAPLDINYTISKGVALGPLPTIEAMVMGANANAHPYQLKSAGNILIDTLFYAYELVKHNFDIFNLPLSGNYTFQFMPLNDITFPGNLNYMQIAYAKLRYSRSFDFGGETLPMKMWINSASPKALLECTNLTATAPRIYVISGDTVKLLIPTQAGGIFKGLVPMTGQEQSCFMVDNSQVFSFTGNATMKSVNADTDPAKFARFNNFKVTGANADFLLISNKHIWTGANSYAAYRTSKGFNVLLADIDELYDQFSWGIKKHPLSIRNFCDQLIDNNAVTPKYLLLLGKSVLSQNSRGGSAYNQNLIPTHGEPASDQIFTSHLNTTKFTPEIATGRVAAQNEADVTAYLDKLISFELQQTLPPSSWMKNVLHFGGGTDLNEQNVLSSKLNVYKQIIQDTLFGGSVSTILKSSTAPIQLNLGQYIQQLIDTGCSMMTFYGHAAGTSFDIATDDPENYNNKDRYPVVLAQSCFVGDIHTTNRLLNERFVLTPDKGSIAFIAVPDKGLIDPLDMYSLRFHEVSFRDNYGFTVGETMKKTVEDIYDSLNFDVKSVCMNMTLHGDPAIKMNIFEKPDYEIKNANIFYEPSIVTTEMDSFMVKFAVANLGKNTSETMHVLISRTMPKGNKRDTIIQVPYITYLDTLSISLPVDFKDGAGLNMFEITVDVYNEVDELDNVGNNVAKSQLLINSTDINPVFPQEYAIVPTGNITLKATTADLFAAAKNYRFEVDTSFFFNSPSKISGVANNAFGVISWLIPQSLDSNRAYYWRVANDSITSLDTAISSKFQWKVSSFLFKPGKTGWSQAHYYQFKESALANMLWVDSIRQTKFISSNYSLLMTHELNRPSYEINGVNMDYGGCFGVTQIAVAVLDSIDFENPWTSDSCTNYFGNYNYYTCNTAQGCGFRTRPDKYFLFNVSAQAGIDSLIDFIQNDVPNGNYLLSWTTFSAPFDTLTTVKNAYNSIGVPQFNNLITGEKFMMFMKKGDPASVIFKKGLFPDSLLRIDYLLTRDWDKGFKSSSVIGPATSWNQLHWNYKHLEPGISPDSIYLQVYGIAGTGQEVLIVDSIVDIVNPIDLSFISASQYPNLRLKSYMEDSQLRTPPQMEKWQVFFDPVPEGSLNTNFYSFFNDSVQEGEIISLSMAFENISSVDMDTLLVSYFVYDANNIRRNISSVRLHRPLPAGDTIMCNVSFSSLNYRGNNSLWIEANPNDDQPEQYHFNNITSLNFTVNPDITNPLLDVTFDGLHILNGDIVSARPEILIKLKDENKYLALNDTSNFRISLRSPSGQLQYLHFEPAQGPPTNTILMGWLPAALPNNSFRIDYHPYLQEDGIYELAVEAKDETGNLSGAFDYKIQFEVINKSTITEVVNYPNPFSTSTRFVFMLTGSEVPTEFKIQIMTVTGKVVREIMREELGNIRIGRNITDYAWDGKDEFGDQLANGVYVYRVITGINGSEIEKRETNADQYFKKGWGKMYLMR